MHPQSKDMVYVANGEVSSEDGIMEKIQRSISRTSAPEHLLWSSPFYLYQESVYSKHLRRPQSQQFP